MSVAEREAATVGTPMRVDPSALGAGVLGPRRSFANTVSFLAAATLGAGVVLGALALPGRALASDDGGGSSDLLWQAVNLVLVLGVLIYFARKPIAEFFSGRRDQIKNDLDSAAELLSRAEARNSDIQRKLIDLQSELEEIRDFSRRRAEEESERILAEARRTAERIQNDASAAAVQELRRAQLELRAEAAARALQLAGQILQDQVTDPDRERLLDEFITRIEPGTGTAG